MYRRIIIFLLLGCLPSMAMAEKLSLAGISTYLQGLKTLEAQFTQINSDQSISTGRLYLHRPGRARFEYNPPDQALVIAGGGAVAIFDLKTGQLPDQFPLKRTPLWVGAQRKFAEIKNGLESYRRWSSHKSRGARSQKS
jgi:outer membrane lipoprotein-sorting protein